MCEKSIHIYTINNSFKTTTVIHDQIHVVATHSFRPHKLMTMVMVDRESLVQTKNINKVVKNTFLCSEKKDVESH